MLSLRLYGKNDIRLDDIPVPEISADEILLKTEAAAVCGTDLRMWGNGAKGASAEHPLILGHEFAGTIVKAGKNVPYYKEGMRVGMQPNIGCGFCNRCVVGDYHLCDTYTAFGINMDGAFAEYIRIPAGAIARGNLMELPAGISFEEAAMCEPLSCVYNGQTKLFIKPGDKALVVGAGPIGMMHAMLLHLNGASVIMNDISAPRLAECKALLPYIDTYCGGDLKGYVMEQTNGQGLDIAVTACPVPSVQAAMPPLMNYGGRVNFFGGVPADKQPVPIDTNLIHYKELYLTGSTRSSIAQFRKVAEMVGGGLLEISRLVTHRYPLSESLAAFYAAARAEGVKHMITFGKV